MATTPDTHLVQFHVSGEIKTWLMEQLRYRYTTVTAAGPDLFAIAMEAADPITDQEKERVHRSERARGIDSDEVTKRGHVYRDNEDDKRKARTNGHATATV